MTGNNKNLYIIRGVSNSGKTTLAKSLGFPVCCADDYFYIDGIYKFDASKLKQAHEFCKQNVENLMISESPNISVANTFTQEWEFTPYIDLANKYNYNFFSIIVERRHNNFNDHNVPEEVLKKQASRFSIKLH